jgi:hypothetical protein
MATTTRDPRGGERPRLIFASGGMARQHASEREFDLLPGVTVIGSGQTRTCDWRERRLATPRSTVTSVTSTSMSTLGSQPSGRVDRQEISSKPQRTGDRIELGTGRCRSGKGSPSISSCAPAGSARAWASPAAPARTSAASHGRAT